MQDNFNFAQQSDPQTYNAVQLKKQQAQQQQSKRLSELGQVYNAAQGPGATEVIQQQVQNRPADTLVDPSTEPYVGIGNNVAQGLNTAYEGLAKIPRFVYSAAAVPQNFLADKLDIPELGAKYENFLQLTDATPVKSPLTMLDQLGDYYGEQSEGYAAKTQKYDDTIFGSLNKGNFKQAGSQILDQIATSAPSIAVMAMTSGAGNAAELGHISKTLANALPFMSQRNAELQDDGSVPEWLKPVNAAANGLAEVIFDQSFGTQAAIQGIVNRFQNEGREAAVNAAKELTGGFMNGALKTVDVLKPFTKGAVEEASTQLAQNIVDKYTIDPEKDLMEGVGDAAIVGSVMTGGLETAANIALPKQRTQAMALNEQQQVLLNELGNENLSPQSRQAVEKVIKDNQSSIESIAKETQEAIAKLNPEQKKEVADLNEKSIAAEILVNDPNVSEEVKKVAEQQVETISKQIEAIKPEKETNETKQPESKTEAVVEEVLPEKGAEESVAELQDYISQATEVAEQHEALAAQETDPVEKQEQLDIAKNAREVITNSEKELSAIRGEEVVAKAEKDLAALKQVTDKVKKYEASMKRLTEAKNNKEISTTEFNDLKKRFDDVIGESKPKVKEETTDALSKQITNEVDVREPSKNGEGMEPGNTKQEEPTGKVAPKEVPVSTKEEKVTKAGDPLRAFASKVREGKINKLGGFKAATGFDAAWDLGLEAVATTIEGGAKIADAIQTGLKAIKQTDWYKSLPNKEEFDKQYQDHMDKEYSAEEEKYSALKNADVAKKRAELGLEERTEVESISNEETVKKAKEKIKDGYDVESLIDDIMDGTREAKADEVVILKQYQLAKEAELIGLGDEIVTATKEGKGTPLDKLIEKRDGIIQDIDRAYQAGEKTGTVSARALQARRIALMNDYSLAGMLIEKRQANAGEKLTEEQINQTTEAYNKIKKLNEQLQKKIDDLIAKGKEQQAEKAFKGIKNRINYEARKTGRVEQRASIDKDLSAAWESLNKKVKSQSGNLSMNAIPVDMIPDLAKIAVLYAKRGINTLDGVVDEMFTNLSESIPELTKEDLKEILIDFDYDSITKNESRLSSFKKRTQAKINEIRGKVETKDFTKKKPTPLKLDEEGIELKDALRKAKYDWDHAVELDRLEQRTQMEKTRDAFTNVINLPRSVMASLDYSAPLRQGLVLGVNNPGIAARAFAEMFRQSWSQQRFDRWISDLKESPQYQVMKESGLYISDPNTAKLSAKEEQFMSNLADKIPVVGRLIKGSERAYVGYLNKLRADVFAKTAEQFENDGKTVENNKKLYEALGTYINATTGRGDLGKFENSAQVLNSLFFSPRLIASRIRLLTNWANPVWYNNTPKEVRVMYAKDMLRFIAVGTTLLALASAGGGDVEKDPRSSDFGKIRVGDKRWDIWGGFQQFAKFFSQMATGERKSTRDKSIRKINGEGFKGESRADLVLNMMRSKLSPLPSVAWNLAEGENMVGEEFTWKDVPGSFLPLLAADVVRATNKDGIPGMLGTGVPGVFGVGVQDFSKGKKGSKGKTLTPQQQKEAAIKASEKSKKSY